MFRYDPEEVANRVFGKGTVVRTIVLSAEPAKENPMFDKNAQRQRAAELSQNLAAQGVAKPVLAPIAPSVKKGPTDKRGKLIQVGQEVARAVSSGRSVTIAICKVTRIEGNRVFLDNSPQSLVYPNRIVVL